MSPPEQVQQAMECLPQSLGKSQKTFNGLNSSFRYWTISDYSRAYTSGDVTPRTVCNIFATVLFFFQYSLHTSYTVFIVICVDQSQRPKRLALIHFFFCFDSVFMFPSYKSPTTMKNKTYSVLPYPHRPFFCYFCRLWSAL